MTTSNRLHASLSYRVICDRGVSHELVRHRIAAYAQESTRWCNYSKDKFGNHVTFIKPLFFPAIPTGTYEPENVHFDMPELPVKEHIWMEAMLNSEQRYLSLLAEKCKPEEARSVLPNSLKTDVVATLDFTAWRHFFNLRTAWAAHPQMRELTIPLLKEFKKSIPLIFDDINIQKGE